MTRTITWSRRNRPSKADGGHSLRRTGTSIRAGHRREHYECECGKVYSGFGDRAFYGWAAHRDQQKGTTR